MIIQSRTTDSGCDRVACEGATIIIRCHDPKSHSKVKITSKNTIYGQYKYNTDTVDMTNLCNMMKNSSEQKLASNAKYIPDNDLPVALKVSVYIR